MLVSGLLAGFIIGLAAGGNWRNLGNLQLKFLPGLALGLIARAVAPFLDGVGLLSSIVGLLLVGLTAFANRAVAGALFIVLGSLLNVVVIALNGGMPIDPAALARSGKPPPADGLHVLLGVDTRLPFLADVLLVPVLNNIYSVGDVVLAIGGFWIAFRVAKPR